jgi:hypothetical protein
VVTSSDAKRRSKLRFEAINGFVDYGARDAELSLPAMVTWFILWRHTRDGRVSVGVSVVMEATKMSRSSVNRSLAELTRKGFLKPVRKGGLGHGVSVRKIAHRSMTGAQKASHS